MATLVNCLDIQLLTNHFALTKIKPKKYFNKCFKWRMNNNIHSRKILQNVYIYNTLGCNNNTSTDEVVFN